MKKINVLLLLLCSLFIFSCYSSSNSNEKKMSSKEANTYLSQKYPNATYTIRTTENGQTKTTVWKVQGEYDKNGELKYLVEKHVSNLIMPSFYVHADGKYLNIEWDDSQYQYNWYYTDSQDVLLSFDITPFLGKVKSFTGRLGTTNYTGNYKTNIMQDDQTSKSTEVAISFWTDGNKRLGSYSISYDDFYIGASFNSTKVILPKYPNDEPIYWSTTKENVEEQVNTLPKSYTAIQTIKSSDDELNKTAYKYMYPYNGQGEKHLHYYRWTILDLDDPYNEEKMSYLLDYATDRFWGVNFENGEWMGGPTEGSYFNYYEDICRKFLASFDEYVYDRETSMYIKTEDDKITKIGFDIYGHLIYYYSNVYEEVTYQFEKFDTTSFKMPNYKLYYRLPLYHGYLNTLQNATINYHIDDNGTIENQLFKLVKTDDNKILYYETSNETEYYIISDNGSTIVRYDEDEDKWSGTNVNFEPNIIVLENLKRFIFQNMEKFKITTNTGIYEYTDDFITYNIEINADNYITYFSKQEIDPKTRQIIYQSKLFFTIIGQTVIQIPEYELSNNA